MQICLSSIDQVINAIEQKTLPEHLPVEGFSLGAVMELAAWAVGTGFTNGVVAAWSQRHGQLAEAVRLLKGGNPRVPKVAYERISESFWPVRSAADLGSLWDQFVERFSAALKGAGFQDGWHNAIAEVFSEMADNVVQHSCLGSNARMNGLVGYRVGERFMSFTVADTGVGVVQSLRDNPKYENVNGRQALDCIAKEQASRRAGQETGKGYALLFQRLAQMNGRIRLRSADGLFSMEGTIFGCSPKSATLHTVPGFHISVECKI